MILIYKKQAFKPLELFKYTKRKQEFLAGCGIE